jgi:hypothetical protein
MYARQFLERGRSSDEVRPGRKAMRGEFAMKNLICIIGMLAVSCMPADVSAASPKHHHKTHRGYAMHLVARPVQSGYDSPVLHRIPSMDPPFCDSPNVVTIEGCRISSNGSW